MRRTSVSSALVAFFGVSAGALALAAPVPSFQGLDDLAGGIFSSHASGVSADGLVVVGQSVSAAGQEAMRWTSDGGMVGLGGVPSFANGVSGDGLVVVGQASLGSGNEAFRWTPGGDIEGLGFFPGKDFSRANGISGDGSVVVGGGSSPNGDGTPDSGEAFHWTEAAGIRGLRDLSGGVFRSRAWGASADGSVIVGFGVSQLSDLDLGREAFRWKDLNGNGLVDSDETLDIHPEFGLGDLDGGRFDSIAFASSADGSVVVGISESASGPEAFRWEDLNSNGQSDPGEMVGLDDLDGGIFSSGAFGISADGSVIVGGGSTPSGSEAFIWDAVHEMRLLRDVLVNEVGLDLTGWTLTGATGISDDGLTIVGSGSFEYSPGAFRTEGWIATIPEPATVWLVLLGGLIMRRSHRGKGGS